MAQYHNKYIYFYYVHTIMYELVSRHVDNIWTLSNEYNKFMKYVTVGVMLAHQQKYKYWRISYTYNIWCIHRMTFDDD